MGAIFITNIALRSLLLVWLVITLGLTGSLIEGQNFGVSQVNFMMFASVFGILFGALYGVVSLFLSFMAFPIVIAALDFLNCVFTFAAATALAVVIRNHSCTNDNYINNNRVAQGNTGRCRKAQADTTFMYFAFLTFLVSLVLSITQGLRQGWGALPSRTKTPAPARTGPSMSQVA